MGFNLIMLNCWLWPSNRETWSFRNARTSTAITKNGTNESNLKQEPTLGVFVVQRQHPSTVYIPLFLCLFFSPIHPETILKALESLGEAHGQPGVTRMSFNRGCHPRWCIDNWSGISSGISSGRISLDFTCFIMSLDILLLCGFRWHTPFLTRWFHHGDIETVVVAGCLYGAVSMWDGCQPSSHNPFTMVADAIHQGLFIIRFLFCMASRYKKWIKMMIVLYDCRGISPHHSCLLFLHPSLWMSLVFVQSIQSMNKCFSIPPRSVFRKEAAPGSAPKPCAQSLVSTQDAAAKTARHTQCVIVVWPDDTKRSRA